MSEQTYKFNVVMTCGGCSGAIERVLKKTKEAGGKSFCLALLPLSHEYKGVSSYDVSLEKQEVLVTGTMPYDDVLAKIKKTGKEVKSGETLP
ncbi:hypothetical protein RSAG8_02374, partial [Rhizoctonia solani AG-8 WAC10335]